jgi:hypothetical protein
VCNIKGDLLNSLKNNIQNFYGPTGSSFYQPIINEYEKKKKTENVNYLVGKDFVRFGPISKVDASTYKSTYTMRNAYSFYWIEDFDENFYKIYLHVFDLFDLAPDWKNKGKLYNTIAEPLHNWHLAAGYNPNMQVRAEWSILVKKK